MKFQRVLIINGEPFNFQNASGVTMSNLFKNWPRNHIAQIYTANVKPDRSVCDNFLKLSLEDLAVLAPAKLFLQAGKRVQCTLFSNRPRNGASVKGNSFLGFQMRKLRALLRPWVDLVPYHLGADLWTWVDDFRPEVIYSCFGSIAIMRAVREVAIRLSIPVVSHFMDDWPATMYASRPVLFVQRHQLTRMLAEVLKRSTQFMAISDAMADEYRQRFGHNFLSFMNVVNVPTEFIPPPEVQGRAVRFLYIGGLHLDRWRSILEVGRALTKITERGVQSELWVYAPQKDIDDHRDELGQDPSTRICGTISQDEIPEAILSSDVAVHVESFSRESRSYTRLSISTKIPQYLAMGRPIVAFAPGELASCKYIEQGGFGRVVGANDTTLLENALIEMAEDSQARLRMGRRGWMLAKKRHDATRERDRFRRELSRAVARAARPG